MGGGNKSFLEVENEESQWRRVMRDHKTSPHNYMACKTVRA
jgi:hypothetical protein